MHTFTFVGLVAQLVEHSVWSVECRGFEVTALGVLCYFALFVRSYIVIVNTLYFV